MSSIRAVSTLILLVATAAACAPAPDSPICRRYAAAHLGPGNDFKAVVAEAGVLEGDKERINVALSVIRPLEAPVTLVHVIGGKEVARWDLQIGGSDGLGARCSIGVVQGLSSCGPAAIDAPHPVGGYYYLQSEGSRVLEAGLSFTLCR